ncbi:MAG: hypothetical protein U0521_27450 [Anaerolineae bacterium]
MKPVHRPRAVMLRQISIQPGVNGAVAQSGEQEEDDQQIPGLRQRCKDGVQTAIMPPASIMRPTPAVGDCAAVKAGSQVADSVFSQQMPTAYPAGR